MNNKDIVWLHSEVKSPSFSVVARIEAGYLLRRLQSGEFLTLPHSRPMPVFGAHCHELRIQDDSRTWRIIYRIDYEAILILEVFEKQHSQLLKM